jgi:putative ABC transport system ATP-binding protein
MNGAADSPAVPVIEMTGVCVTRLKDPSQRVVEGVDWQVQAGDFWVVAGLHGSGRSDFLMLAAGLSAPASGTYRLFGEVMPIVEDGRLATRLRLGLVFDGGQLLNHLTVAENVALPLRYHQNRTAAEADERVQAMLDLTGLTPWANHPPSAVGRNWRKRAGLARALMLQPEVLLLDNPMAGLDLRHAHWWLEFLDQLSAGHSRFGHRPLTLVVTSEHLHLWRGHARQFALLEDHALNVLGDWTGVERSSDPLARELLAAEPEGARPREIVPENRRANERTDR